MALLLSLAAPAAAQTRWHLPPVEFGARVGAMSTLAGGLPGLGVSVTLRLTRRLAVEADANVLARTDLGAWRGRAAFYQVGVRGSVLRFRSGLEVFWTAGGAGAVAQSQYAGRRATYLFGWPIDAPARPGRLMLPPVMVTGGAGVLVPLGPHVAWRSDLRVLVTPVGPVGQAAIAVTVQINRLGSR